MPWIHYEATLSYEGGGGFGCGDCSDLLLASAAHVPSRRRPRGGKGVFVPLPLFWSTKSPPHPRFRWEGFSRGQSADTGIGWKPAIPPCKIPNLKRKHKETPQPQAQRKQPTKNFFIFAPELHLAETRVVPEAAAAPRGASPVGTAPASKMAEARVAFAEGNRCPRFWLKT